MLLAAVAALLLCGTGPSLRLERAIHDALWPALKPAQAGGVRIVGIDEISMEILAAETDGYPWPFPRQWYAGVLQRLADAGAAAVFVDVLFDQPSTEADDQALEDAIRYATEADTAVLLAAELDEDVAWPPLARFLEAGAIEANVRFVPDRVDGLVRYARYGSRLPESWLGTMDHLLFGLLPLERERRTAPPGRTRPAAPVHEALRRALRPGTELPRGGRIRFPPSAGWFPQTPFFELHHEALAAEHLAGLEGRVVFLGVTMEASVEDPSKRGDVFPTPAGPFPGVEAQAASFASYHAGGQAVRAPALVSYLLYAAWAAGMLAMLGRIRHPAFAFAGLAGGLLPALGIASVLAQGGWIVLLTPPVICAGLWFVGFAGARYLEERDAKVQMQTQLFHYLPRNVAEHQMEKPFRLARTRDRVPVTVLFGDLVGFTTISEREPVDVVLPLLQEHLGQMTEAIFSHEGTLDKFLGDGIMAFWGAPQRRSDHAEAALGAAQSMQRSVEVANARRRGAGRPELHLCLGLHTGEAIVGNLGSELFLDYTAIGDTVNTASRIEGLNRLFGTRILLSGATRAQLPPATLTATRMLARVAVKGRATGLEVYTIATGDDLHACNALRAVLEATDRGEIAAAIDEAESIRAWKPDFVPAQFHLDRLRAQAPERGEDGKAFWRLTQK
jgi:adenylate cyclase